MTICIGLFPKGKWQQMKLNKQVKKSTKHIHILLCILKKIMYNMRIEERKIIKVKIDTSR